MNDMRLGQYGVGQEAEQELAQRLAKRGWVVIPVSEYVNNTGLKVNAPMLVVCGGLTISPDLLAMKSGKSPIWCEVKTKTEPTYTWKYHQWEHGIDSPHADAYLKIRENTGYPVILFIKEKRSPMTPDLNLDLREDTSAHKKVASDLRPSDIWLWITLDDAFKYGKIRKGNHEMVKNTNPEGRGLYWPRASMKEWHDTVLAEGASIAFCKGDAA